MIQDAWVDRGGVANQAGRDAYYIDQRVADAALAAPLRPPAQRLDHEPRIRGRDDLVDELEGLLDRRTDAPGVRVLCGMGGCGKTTVALELARRTLAHDIPAWWVSATGPGAVAAGMQALAVALGADPDQLRLGSPAEIVWSLLTGQARPWLLIFDNADDPHPTLGLASEPVTRGNGWIRPVDGPGLVVVTSRDGGQGTWGGCRWIRTHPVRRLAAEDAGAVLLDFAGPAAGSPREAIDLAERLGRLPLALRAAGSYLANTTRIPASLADPQTPRTYAAYSRALDNDPPPSSGTGDTSPTDELSRTLVGDTWELSLKLLEQRGMTQARPLLQLLSSLAPAPIPYGVIFQPDVSYGAGDLAGITSTHLWSMLHALADLGLVDLREPPGDDVDERLAYTVTLHPLVRHTYATLPDRRDEPPPFLALAVQLVAQRARSSPADSPQDPEAWPWWQALAPHAFHMLRRVAALAHRLDPDVTIQACAAATLAGQYLQERWLNRAAEIETRTLLDLRHRVLGPEHPDTLTTRHDLARALHGQGQNAVAGTEYLVVLEAQQRILGETHPDTLTTRYSYANSVHDRCQYEQAEAEYRALLAVAAPALGEEHPLTMEIRNDLGVVLAQTGHHDQAEAEYQAVFVVLQRVLGPDHPDTLTTRYNLACLLQDRGDLDAAAVEFHAILDTERRLLGNDHFLTLLTRFRFAQLLYGQGQVVAAEAELRAVLDAQRRVHGADADRTLKTQQMLEALFPEPQKAQPDLPPG